MPRGGAGRGLGYAEASQQRGGGQQQQGEAGGQPIHHPCKPQRQQHCKGRDQPDQVALDHDGPQRVQPQQDRGGQCCARCQQQPRLGPGINPASAQPRAEQHQPARYPGQRHRPVGHQRAAQRVFETPARRIKPGGNPELRGLAAPLRDLHGADGQQDQPGGQRGPGQRPRQRAVAAQPCRQQERRGQRACDQAGGDMGVERDQQRQRQHDPLPPARQALFQPCGNQRQHQHGAGGIGQEVRAQFAPRAHGSFMADQHQQKRRAQQPQAEPPAQQHPCAAQRRQRHADTGQPVQFNRPAQLAQRPGQRVIERGVVIGQPAGAQAFQKAPVRAGDIPGVEFVIPRPARQAGPPQREQESRRDQPCRRRADKRQRTGIRCGPAPQRVPVKRGRSDHRSAQYHQSRNNSLPGPVQIGPNPRPAIG